MTSRCKSGRRRNQVTFVAARGRLGRPGRQSAGSSPSLGRVQASGPQHKAKPAASTDYSRKGATGSRVPSPRTKDREGGKRLERQRRRTQRRGGRGKLGQPAEEQESAVSAAAQRA